MTASGAPPACHHQPRRRAGHPYEITKAQGAAPGRGAANAASPARQRRNFDASEKNWGCRGGPGSGGGGGYRTWRTDRREGGSEEQRYELKSLMRTSIAAFRLKKKNKYYNSKT